MKTEIGSQSILSFFVILTLCSCTHNPKQPPLPVSAVDSNSKINLEILNDKLESSHMRLFICDMIKMIDSSKFYTDINKMKKKDYEYYKAFQLALVDDIFESNDMAVEIVPRNGAAKKYERIKGIDTSVLIIQLMSHKWNDNAELSIKQYTASLKSMGPLAIDLKSIMNIYFKKCIDYKYYKFIDIRSDEMCLQMINNVEKMNTYTDVLVLERVYWKAPKETSYGSLGSFEAGYLLQKVYHYNFNTRKLNSFYLKSGNNQYEIGDPGQAIFSRSMDLLDTIIRKSFLHNGR